MKKEKDLIAARYLNAHIMAPSNCFDLIDVPSVRLSAVTICRRE